MRITEFLIEQKWIGEMVVVEGTFPIPVGQGQVAYAPAKGVLKAIFDDGIAVQEDGEAKPTLFWFANLRSIATVTEVRTMRSSIVMPGH